MVHKDIELDDSSATPIYEQLIEQIALGVASGRLRPGDRLPSVRSLATELRLNPNTAARALREAERLGLASSERGRGTFVAVEASAVAKTLTTSALDREAGRLTAVARRLGLGLDDLYEALARHWEAS